MCVCNRDWWHIRRYTGVTAAFQPESKDKLKAAIALCVASDCSAGQNGPINDWDVSRVMDMSSMFYGATSFKGDISKWNVASVTDMNSMFMKARSFNGDISNWDVSSVQDMVGMFNGATSFTRTLCGAWKVSTASGKDSMFVDSGGQLCSGALFRGESD